ncbi:MarR family winged helix-turn-helix transcriptional regulator [Micromonospora peucetia]|uniref:DNA-binding transcriptional regulator, MarR family n=1 Tax=Micromonospora peucetia TaxID=47871 RepID=A0A1C6VY95_9ACTN|nr:MarR family winged helix-turn-helix transcriptional regulator [Micromonospora peucetia]MCX4390618.1 MarR family winged helix-turn-helix transcriptional regulator [Micromonospora peucetia]WSA31555.1 MarR family winged helix-turn-helix transcriptional regulator [Micromonospora peucetia]SCL71266.1 DNA-binding transcriptional regulator, MarR family [Micromonospora peucetia]
MTGDTDDGGDGLAEAFRAVTRRLRHRTREALAPWDVTPGQSRALGVLIRHGTLRLSALAEHLRIAPRSATEVVDDLEARGLVRRRPDPADRRATLVAPTEEGIRTGAAIHAARRAAAEDLFGGLAPADRDQLTRILRTLRD